VPSTYCEDLYRAEGKAKRDKVGMWVQGQKYESPAAYRRRLKVVGE
jgi:endonuclease YncB( thermonuclease family)